MPIPGRYISLLTKKLEVSEKQKSDYLKRYDDAIDDKKKVADDYTNQLNNLQSKYSSVDERCSSLLKTLDSVKKESFEWKRKYEEGLLKQKAVDDEASAEIAMLKSRGSAAEASLAALCEQAQSTKEEAEVWKRKYEIAAMEAKSSLRNTAVVQENTTKSMQTREDMLRAEFIKILTEKDDELKDKMAKMDQVEQQLTTLQLGLKVLEEKLEAANVIAQSYERQSKILEQEKIFLEEKYQPEFMMIEELQERCTAAEKESRKAVEVADKARAEAVNALKEKSDIQQIFMEREAQIEKLERQVEKLERQKKDLADELTRIRDSEMDAKTKVMLLEGRVEEREKEIESQMKLNNAERSSTVKVLNDLLEAERHARAEANRRAEALSVQLQTTQGKLDQVQQELASVCLNESVLEEKLEASTSNGKRPNTPLMAHQMRADSSAEDDRLITRVRKKLKSIVSPFRQTASPEDGVDQMNSEDYTKFTLQKLEQELLKHNFGTELRKLANPSKKQVLGLYERCILQKY